MSAVLLGTCQEYLLALRIDNEETTFEEDKKEHKYSYNGSRQHLACSFMPACLRCRSLVDTSVLLYELCCSVQGRFEGCCSLVLVVDTVTSGAWFVPALCAQKRNWLKKTKK